MLIRFCLILLISAVIALTLWSRQIVLMALIGVGLAVIAEPFICKMKEKLNSSRPIITVLFYLLLLIFISGIFALVAYISADQYKSLSNELPNYISNLEKMIASHVPQFESFEKFLESTSFSSAIKEVLQRIYQVSSGVITSLSGIGLSLFVAFYMSLNYRFYSKQLPRVFKNYPNEEVENLSSNLATTLRAWFKAQMIDMIIVAGLTTLGLWIIDFEYWLVIGLIAGVVGMIPYLGIIIVFVLASIISIAQNPSNLPWVVLVFAITQQIEGNFILPKLMKKEVSLPEFPLIIFLFLMGQWLGILGAIVAAPVLALTIEAINHKRKPENYILKVDNDT